jgi:hypothetical protein
VFPPVAPDLLDRSEVSHRHVVTYVAAARNGIAEEVGGSSSGEGDFMELTLHVRASPAAAAAAAVDSAGRARSAELVATAANICLRDVVSADFDITFVGPDGSPRELRVAVSFPDEARALLQELSWCEAQSIVDTVFEIGAAYAARALAPRLCDATWPSSDADARVPPTLRMPLESFREGLAAVRASAAVM